eukprot:COSAG01_NODE_1276_length_10938_cov_76.499862_2_plen_75_part_00
MWVAVKTPSKAATRFGLAEAQVRGPSGCTWRLWNQRTGVYWCDRAPNPEKRLYDVQTGGAGAHTEDIHHTYIHT